MRVFSALAALLVLASGAHAQDSRELVEGLVLFAELADEDSGMSPARESEVATWLGFTGMHEVELEAGVEYELVVVTDLVGGLDPDFYVEGPDGSTLVNAEGSAETEERARFTAAESGTHMVSVELYNCEDEEECFYGVVLLSAQ